MRITRECELCTALSCRNARVPDQVARLRCGRGLEKWNISLPDAFETRDNVGSFSKYTLTPFYFANLSPPHRQFNEPFSRGRLTILRCTLLTKGWKFSELFVVMASSFFLSSRSTRIANSLVSSHEVGSSEKYNLRTHSVPIYVHKFGNVGIFRKYPV